MPLKGLQPLPITQAKFRHFKEEEIEIFKDFAYTMFPNALYYFDVPLHIELPEWLEKEPEWLKEQYMYLRAKKIDAVIETEEKYIICEVKGRVRPSAIGQLIVYRDMFINEYKPEKPVELFIVAKYYDKEVSQIAKSYGIKVWVKELGGLV